MRNRVTRGELQDAMCVGRVAGVVTRQHGNMVIPCPSLLMENGRDLPYEESGVGRTKSRKLDEVLCL